MTKYYFLHNFESAVYPTFWSEKSFSWKLACMSVVAEKRRVPHQIGTKKLPEYFLQTLIQPEPEVERDDPNPITM